MNRSLFGSFSSPSPSAPPTRPSRSWSSSLSTSAAAAPPPPPATADMINRRTATTRHSSSRGSGRNGNSTSSSKARTTVPTARLRSGVAGNVADDESSSSIVVGQPKPRAGRGRGSGSHIKGVAPPSPASCLCLEDVLFSLFTPPRIGSLGACSGSSSEQYGRPMDLLSTTSDDDDDDDDSDDNSSDDDSDDDNSDDDDDDDDEGQAVNVSMHSVDSSVVRRYCRIWKAKRRKEKERARQQRKLWNLLQEQKQQQAWQEIHNAATIVVSPAAAAAVEDEDVGPTADGMSASAVSQQEHDVLERSFEVTYDDRGGDRGLHPRGQLVMK